MRHGQGKFIDSQGNQYTGGWKDDKMHGDGEMTRSDEGRKLIGYWVKGRLQGKGTIVTADGKKEEAKWKDGI